MEAEIKAFELPTVEGSIVNGGDPTSSPPTAQELGKLHQEAWNEGYAAGEQRGYQEGLARGSDAAERELQALRGIASSMAQPLAQFDEALVESIADLALLIAGHLVRRELKTSQGEVVGVVREALKHLPVTSQKTTIRLNPEDVELVREAMSLGEGVDNWFIDADPLISRGGCVLDTETSRVDASVESRIAAIASQMFGGERESDRVASES